MIEVNKFDERFVRYMHIKRQQLNCNAMLNLARHVVVIVGAVLGVMYNWRVVWNARSHNQFAFALIITALRSTII